MAENNKNFVKATINPTVNLYNPTKIKTFRKKYNLTRVELSNLTGISINALQLWELGQATPHYKYWRKLLSFMRDYEYNNC
ncbi:MAG: helix-turn-helix transcriptional regulator [Eubacterium sp.]|nr:helix-turn-helix transcriptional regulator [Eubacterium sp.]